MTQKKLTPLKKRTYVLCFTQMLKSALDLKSPVSQGSTVPVNEKNYKN